MSSQWWTQPPIVLVEDDVNDEFCLRSALFDARIGNPLVVFNAADAARTHVSGRRSDPPALFLLDIRVHGAESGLDFLRWLRDEPSPLGSTPAIVLTGSGADEERRESFGLGALSFLSKPVASADLIDCIQSLGFDNIPDPASGEVGFRVIRRRAD
jgi:CheY-like chemotaxis protein